MEYPQIFAIIEELSHYSGLVVIPDNIITVNLIPFSYIATNYPSISIMNEVLTLILPILQTLSANFLLMIPIFYAQDVLLHCLLSISRFKDS